MRQSSHPGSGYAAAFAGIVLAVLGPGAAMAAETPDPTSTTSPAPTPLSPVPSRPAPAPSESADRYVDIAAIGDTVVGSVGDLVTITVGVKNVGNKTLIGYEDEPTVGINVTVPAGTSVRRLDDPWCGKDDRHQRRYGCDFNNSIEPGEVRTVTFKLRIDRRVAGAEGMVVIPETMVIDDRDRANDTARIPVRITASGGGELADTGAPAALTAVIGALAVLLGIAALAGTSRLRRARSS